MRKQIAANNLCNQKKQKYDLLLLTARASEIQDAFKIHYANETSLYYGFHYLP